MDMMTRRRAMMGAASGTLPEWDFEWDYSTDGLPTTVGMTLSTSGTGPSSTLTENGVDMKAGNSNNASGRAYYTKTSLDSNICVAEYTFIIPNNYVSSTASHMRGNFRIGTSEGGIFIVFYHKQWGGDGGQVKFWDGSIASAATEIGTWAGNTEYTLRLTLNNGVGKAELNDVLLSDSLDASTILYKGGFTFGVQHSRAYIVRFKKVKVKVGRTT